MSEFLDGIGTAIGTIFKWFSPEQRAKAKRERRTNIEKELRKLKKQKCTEEISRKIERLENELEKINNSLSS